MKKMMRGFGIVTMVVLVLAFTGQSFGFCVHNKSDRKMYAEQVFGGKTTITDFNVSLSPGESECCHWSNTDCNETGRKTVDVGFNVLWYEWLVIPEYVCKDARIPACSDLDIVGSNGSYKCVTHGTETCN